jgi:hypothetical protein
VNHVLDEAVRVVVECAAAEPVHVELDVYPEVGGKLAQSIAEELHGSRVVVPHLTMMCRAVVRADPAQDRLVDAEIPAEPMLHIEGRPLRSQRRLPFLGHDLGLRELPRQRDRLQKGSFQTPAQRGVQAPSVHPQALHRPGQWPESIQGTADEGVPDHALDDRNQIAGFECRVCPPAPRVHEARPIAMCHLAVV